MKILWFEVTTPSGYKESGQVLGGWQDALERIVRQQKDIELHIAFEHDGEAESRTIGSVTYLPMNTHHTWWKRKVSQYSCKPQERHIMEQGLRVIEQVKPDLIHVFGCEWPFGLLASLVDVPLVVHIMGSIIPYNNALFPPRYNEATQLRSAGLNIRTWLHLLRAHYRSRSCLQMEKRTWAAVSHYMGRTCWDKALVNTLHPTATYHHVEEGLRPAFMKTEKRWQLPEDGRLRLFTTGISSFWKGIDTLLKTAAVLKQAGVDYEWNVAGWLGDEIRRTVEKKEGLRFADYNINILGPTQPEQLVEHLCQTTLYVHTAYIDNSPNSMCEAQVLGVPVVSTNVGGISTLVRNGVDGDLVPANDPWQMADAIIRLSRDKKRMKQYSENTLAFARQRHSEENILAELMTCYNDLLKK